MSPTPEIDYTLDADSVTYECLHRDEQMMLVLLRWNAAVGDVALQKAGEVRITKLASKPHVLFVLEDHVRIDVRFAKAFGKTYGLGTFEAEAVQARSIYPLGDGTIRA